MRAVLLPVAFALALAVPVGAHHCVSWTTSDPWVDTTDASGSRYYVDIDIPQTPCCYSVWIYEEANGLDGLQRGDEVVDNTCHGSIRADKIIF